MSRDQRAASDAALVMAVARYDEAALRELYERHGRAVFGLARRVVGDAAVAEEVLQDVFVRLWERPERFDPERGELKSFLLRDGHSRAVDRVRSDAARRRREDRHETDRERSRPPDDIEREVWDLIRSEKVKEALATLSAGEREAITLAYFGGHSYRDVARMLDQPEGTIKGRIRLGLQKLAGHDARPEARRAARRLRRGRARGRRAGDRRGLPRAQPGGA
jgi:RNA polymerase sigma-70 factor (ECF subfamily)